MECISINDNDNSSSDWESQINETAESQVSGSTESMVARSVKSTPSTSSRSILESYVDTMDRSEQVNLSLYSYIYAWFIIYTGISAQKFSVA